MPRGGPNASCVDRLLQTDRLEYLDRDDVDDKVKRSVIRALEWTGEFFGNTEKFARIALDEVADVADPKILELGSGHGGLSRKLLEWHPTAEVTVTDIEAQSVKAIKAGDLGEHPRATVRRMDATAIDAPDGRFDLAVFAFSFHHLPPSLASRVFAEGTRVADQARDHRPAAATVAAAHPAAGGDAAAGAGGAVRARRRDQLAAHLQPVGAASAGRARRSRNRGRVAGRADGPAGGGGQPLVAAIAVVETVVIEHAVALGDEHHQEDGVQDGEQQQQTAENPQRELTEAADPI